MPARTAFAIVRASGPDVFADLRRRIVALEIPPGAALVRPDLQRDYGVSSTPVRDALLRLQDEGLVVIYPQSRTLVTRIDLGHARQAQFLRSAVEQNVVHGLSAHPDPGLLDELRHIRSLQAAQADRRDLAGFAALDRAFHRRLFEAAAVPDLFRLVRRESGHIDRLRALHLPLDDKMARILMDHRNIVEAIERAAPDTARAAMRAHLSQSIAFGEQLRAQHPAYFTP